MPPVGICKSPAVLVDAAVHVVVVSLDDQAIFLGSPLAPNAITCRSLLTNTPAQFVGALVRTIPVASGEPEPESGLHL